MGIFKRLFGKGKKTITDELKIRMAIKRYFDGEELLAVYFKVKDTQLIDQLDSTEIKLLVENDKNVGEVVGEGGRHIKGMVRSIRETSLEIGKFKIQVDAIK